MQPPDPEQLGIATKIGLIISGLIGSALTAIGLRNRAKDKAEALEAARQKAIDDRFDRHHKANEEHVAGLKTLLEHRRQAEVDIFRQLGADGPIMRAIGELTEQTGRFQVEVMRELGERPKRAEVTDLIELSAKAQT